MNAIHGTFPPHGILGCVRLFMCLGFLILLQVHFVIRLSRLLDKYRAGKTRYERREKYVSTVFCGVICVVHIRLMAAMLVRMVLDSRWRVLMVGTERN